MVRAELCRLTRGRSDNSFPRPQRWCDPMAGIRKRRVSAPAAQSSRPAPVAYLFGVVLALVGCGEDPALTRLDKAIPNRKVVVPLRGMVTVDGQPGPQLMVTLVPKAESAPSSTCPKTTTDEQGAFRFTTYLDGDGVPPGEYRVLVEWLNRIGSGGWSGPDKLNNLYNHLDAPAATVTVVEGTPVADLKLELKNVNRPAKQAPPYQRPRTGKPIKDRRGKTL